MLAQAWAQVPKTSRDEPATASQSPAVLHDDMVEACHPRYSGCVRHPESLGPGKGDCQAGGIIGQAGQPAAIRRIRRRLGAWRTATTSPRAAPGGPGVAPHAQDYPSGRYERDQREGDADGEKHARVRGTGELVTVCDGRQRPEIGGQVL